LDFQRENLGVGKNTKMTFEIRDAKGNPISNLEPLTAAGGHCVIIDADGREFLHVHPVEEVSDVAGWRGGPSVSFLVNFQSLVYTEHGDNSNTKEDCSQQILHLKF
jgi:hypothetical protein